jgi:signal peptidase
MKRAIGLIFLVVACLVGFLTIKGSLPFMPIFGHSMEPTLHSGSLLMIKSIDPKDVKVGDIIVYNVPTMVRDYYSYPPIVSHRVVEIKTVPTLGFRTKGDNTGEDPFTIRPMDIRGTVGSQIPFLGLPLLFFQSQQGLIFVVVALVLLTIFLYGGELLRGGNLLHKGIFAPVINEEKRSNRVLTRKIESTEKKMDHTEQALDKFSTAISEYAKHLASHTSAVKSLAEASQELKNGAAEQNRVLMALAENMGKASLKQETIAPRIEQPVWEKHTWRPQKTIQEILPQPRLQKPVEEIKPQPRPQKPPEKTVKPFHADLNRPAPPGCARRRQELTQEALAAEKEIFSALDRLHSKLDKIKSQE